MEKVGKWSTEKKSLRTSDLNKYSKKLLLNFLSKEILETIELISIKHISIDSLKIYLASFF